MRHVLFWTASGWPQLRYQRDHMGKQWAVWHARYKRRRFQEAAQSSNLIGKIGRLSCVGDITFRGGIAGKVPSLARPVCRISENQCPSLTSVPLMFFWWRRVFFLQTCVQHISPRLFRAVLFVVLHVLQGALKGAVPDLGQRSRHFLRILLFPEPSLLNPFLKDP